MSDAARPSPSLADVLVDLGLRALEDPEAVALVPGREPSAAVSRGELCRRVDACAGRLAADGMAAGDPVLFSVRPSVASIVLLLALVACRAQVVFVDPGTGPELFARRLGRVEPRWVLAESLLYAASGRTPARLLARRRGLELPALGRLDVRHVRVGPWLPGTPLRARSYRRLVRAGGGPPAPSRPVDEEAAALVIFTSGTTSAPKAVAHTWASLGAGLDAAGRLLDLSPTDVVLTEEVHSLIPALRAGARVVLPPPGADGADRLALLSRHQVTHAFLVPADAAALLDAAAHDSGGLARLRAVVLGAAPVGAGLLRRFRHAAPDARILSVYAMTEMLPVAVADAEEKLAHAAGPGDLVGAPVLGVRVRIVDDELHVGGPALARPDLGGPQPEWYPTGDLARLDEHGRIVLLGRRKAMVIRGHRNLYPGLYEPAAEAVEGVRAAALVGVREGDDERAVLLVEPLPGSPVDGLAERVRTALTDGPHRIDAHAQPDAVLIAPLPRAGRSSKLDRPAAAGLAAHLLAGTPPP